MTRRRRATSSTKQRIAPWAAPIPHVDVAQAAIPIRTGRREVVVVAARNVAGALATWYSPGRWCVQIIIAGFPRQPVAAITTTPEDAESIAAAWTRWAVAAASSTAPVATTNDPDGAIA